jgi:hypothetical protein
MEQLHEIMSMTRTTLLVMEVSNQSCTAAKHSEPTNPALLENLTIPLMTSRKSSDPI